MPRKLRKIEESSAMPKSRMESVPGAEMSASERTPHPDFAQTKEDINLARSTAHEETVQKVEALREEIGSPDIESLQRDLAVLQAEAAKLQEQFDADGIGPDIYTLDDAMDAGHRLASKTRKNMGGWSRFMSRLGSALTGSVADPEFYDDMIGRYHKLKELEESISQREDELKTLIKPKRRSSRVRGVPSSSTIIEHGIRGGVSVGSIGDAHIIRDMKKSYAARKDSAKVKAALNEVAEEIGPVEESQPMNGMELTSIKQDLAESWSQRNAAKKVKEAVGEAEEESPGLSEMDQADEMSVQRSVERAAAQEARAAGKLGKRGRNVEEFEKSFGIDEEPAKPEPEEIEVDLSELNKSMAEEAPVEREQLSRKEMQAIKRLKQMSEGLESLRQEVNMAGSSDMTALEHQGDYQERMKLFETGIEGQIEANLDSTSDELYESVVNAQGALKSVKDTYDTVYGVLNMEIKEASKKKRAMGVMKTGGRSTGGASFGSAAGGRSGMVQNASSPEAVSEEAWQKELASAEAGYKKHLKGIKAQETRSAAAQGIEVQNVPELHDEFTEQARRAEWEAPIAKMAEERAKEELHRLRTEDKETEVKQARKSGIKVSKVEKLSDPFSERQSYYEQNADLMKWAMENKEFNAADIWERVNADLEKVDEYDRSEIANALGNAPDLAAAYVLTLVKIARGDEPLRKKIATVNLALGRDPYANIETTVHIAGDMVKDIEKAGQKVVRGKVSKKKTA